MEPEFDALKEYQTQARLLVWSGFFNEADLANFLLDLEHDPDAQGITKEIEEHARAEMAKKREAEKAWPPTNDCDRLDAAFRAIEDQRILALHNAGYTRQDAISDAWDIMSREPEGAWTGYCYYHGQDVEAAVQAHPLFIGFDARSDDAQAKRAVGETVAMALRAADFTVEWNNDPETRMSITNIDWKRRTHWESIVERETAATSQTARAPRTSLGDWFRGLFG